MFPFDDVIMIKPHRQSLGHTVTIGKFAVYMTPFQGKIAWYNDLNSRVAKISFKFDSLIFIYNAMLNMRELVENIESYLIVC